MVEADNALAKRVWGPWATVGFGLVIGIASFIVQILVAIVVGIVIYTSNPGLTSEEFIPEFIAVNGLQTTIATIASAIIGGGFILVVIILRKGISVKEYLGLRKISRKAVFLSLAVVIALIVISDLTSYVLGRPINTDFMVEIYNTSVSPVLLWLAIVIFAPVFEEGFFRGFMFGGFINSRLGVVGTVFLTSLIWVLLHMQYGVFELFILFVSGILLGIARYKTGSLWTPLLMHSFMNAIAMLEVAISINSLIG
ncbi:CPBP family intramembrane glutamic endopeptidase [Chloroflexota bacterium]